EGYQLLLDKENRLDSVLNARKAFLDHFSQTLGNTATHLLALEIVGRRYLDFYRTLEIVLPVSKASEGSVVSNLLAIYHANYLTPPTPSKGDTLAAYTRDYSTYIFRNHLLKNYIANTHLSGFNAKV